MRFLSRGPNLLVELARPVKLPVSTREPFDPFTFPCVAGVWNRLQTPPHSASGALLLRWRGAASTIRATCCQPPDFRRCFRPQGGTLAAIPADLPASSRGARLLRLRGFGVNRRSSAFSSLGKSCGPIGPYSVVVRSAALACSSLLPMEQNPTPTPVPPVRVPPNWPVTRGAVDTQRLPTCQQTI